MSEPEAREPPSTPRRTFAPVVLAGLASTGIAAVAGSKPWAHGTGRAADQVAVAASSIDAGQVPAANALALVCLACWGVLLVTRGRVRRAVAALAVLAAVGVAGAVVVGFTSAPRGVRTAYSDLGSQGVGVHHTGWFWISAVAALAAIVTTLTAARLVPTWPEMGRRYDAPADAPARPAPVAEPSSLDLWRAIDEGEDPTLDSTPDPSSDASHETDARP